MKEKMGRKEIIEMINRETNAWNNQNAEELTALFHPDMVWPWPKNSNDHDPMKWVITQGRFNADRWKKNWQELFDSYHLVHNFRDIKKIEMSKEQDGAFAVVDIDTLWKHKKNGKINHWKGRTCKVYSKTHDGWKLIMHTGVLVY